MKIAALILSALVGSAVAAPALVWKSNREGTVVHTSESIEASSLLASAVSGSYDDSSLASVVFLVSRDEDGTEALTRLASSGSLPGVASKYDAAESIHHHVTGIESTHTVARDARKGLGDSNVQRVLDISLSEFNRKLASLSEKDNSVSEAEVTGEGLVSKATKVSNKRSRALSKADVLVVTVSSKTDAADLDSAVTGAIEHGAVNSVVLAGIRSTDEVKHERMLANRRRMSIMQKARASRPISGRRRRLDDGQNNNNNNNNDDEEVVHYVYMTPNIFAGILFFLFFTMVAWIGIGCMGMIQGQDVYVTKMPPIGREV